MSSKTVEKQISGLEVAQVYVRKAKASDLNNEMGTARKLGQPFWVKSQKTGKFDNAPHILSTQSNKYEIKAWLEQGMLYVPVSYGELIDSGAAPLS